MKRGLSLKWLVVLAFLVQGLILVVGYSFLTARYLIEGMDNIVADNMEQIARHYFKQTSQTGSKEVRRFNNYLFSYHWEEQPEEVKKQFKRHEVQPNQLYKSHLDENDGRPRVTFLLHLIEQGRKIYISFSISRHTTSALTIKNISSDFQALIIISVLSAFSLALVIWLLSWRIGQPIARLGQWARTLATDRLNQSTPDFSYPELNAFAELIRSNLKSVQESTEREQRLLRHTSHELRTPITTICSNVELLKKLDAQKNQQHYEAAICRIDRASLTMKYLTETLLWLHHDRADELPMTECRLDEIIQHLVDDMRYLLSSKQVSVHIETQPYTLYLPEAAARIVLGNLIRNAFQHTWEGQVNILQNQGMVQITNEQSAETEKEDLGFGLGLELTNRLCQRLGWHYQNEQKGNGHFVTLVFPDPI
ncbi:HAMP domain-containing histidine kinase [Endozoicomonas sp. SM1973]|uniref:histidine kinase n=1 Tax=Spartinivicinus marinus TaxID=2994442 RepID=A0A853IDS6_9GAMM|nr:HAMP domain-containing sensor histidine kinase [Spartinivicinus marinus]MCX4026250.1 HAMP domain-containing sensor histidine kinase [Spartinivicinus marinus]NYZ67335.1 HAMP domain-containing histidine kinase [Spartinivicinus marinus]